MISVINKFRLNLRICLFLREFELRGDVLPWHQRCENCGELNLPVWVNEVGQFSFETLWRLATKLVTGLTNSFLIFRITRWRIMTDE